MSFDFNNPAIRQQMIYGNFGLEKESLRVTRDGFLSHTAHPFPDNPNMDRDFCENQTELITDVWDSVEGAWTQLAQLHTKAVRTLRYLDSGAELLWPFSNPPYVRGESDIPIATYHGRLHGKEQYRQYLAQKYGRRKMLFSGIHFNFSFSEELLHEGFRSSGQTDYRVYRDSIYLELAKKVTRYSWLIVYLTSASPVMDGSLFCDEDIGLDVPVRYASVRCSAIGYWNDFLPLLKYDDLHAYVQSIHDYVDAGQLREAAELYYPVRLKPKGENSLRNLEDTGVNHIELRTLDLNPLSPFGIEKQDLIFLHALMLYLMSKEDQRFEDFEQKMAIENVKQAAQYHVDSIRIETGWNAALPIRDAARGVLDDMSRFYSGLEYPELSQAVEKQKQKFSRPGGRYAEQVRERFGHDFVKNGLALAETYAAELIRH